MKIAVIDYKSGNIRNVQKAIESLGAEAKIISNYQSLDLFDGIILPGVGNFKNGMASLNDSGLAKLIYSEVKDLKKPLMGICLGMQLLAESGEEGGFTKGLGLLPMKVQQFEIKNRLEKIPHMGWNSITPNKESLIFKNIPVNSDFYFANSYHVVLEDESMIAASCNYIYPFPAAVESGNIFGTQFHPEKSQRFGNIVLKNFLSFCSISS